VDIVLASASPRRRELLKKIVDDFRVVPSGVDETKIKERDPVKFALEAAILKARDIGERHPSSLVIAADTIVCLGNRIIGKPRDREDARRTLGALSGTRHRVITAVALFKKDEGKLRSGYEESFVRFRRLDASAVETYLDSGDSLDKAGSYAIQEVNDAFVESLEGDYDNVVGLPVGLLRRLLESFLAGEARAL
jgi:septum formation protein